MNSVFLVFIFIAICGHQVWSTLYDPCPEYFKYVISAKEKYGIVTIPGPSKGRTILQVTVGARKGKVYDESDDERTVRVYTRKPLDDAVKDGQEGKDIEFQLNFPDSDELPFVTKIELNNREVCVGPNVTTSWTRKYAQYINFPKDADKLSTINYRPTQQNTEKFLSLPFTDVCGKRTTLKDKLEITHLIIGGEKADRGEFPWLTALLKRTKNTWEYICAGTLITDKHIITAAHCETNKYSDMQIQVGRYDLRDRTENFENRNPILIVAHKDYVAGKPDHDIAIIFIQPVKFNADIKPICLWGFGNRYDTSYNEGTITGWGRVENDGDKSPVPRKLKVKRVEEDTCRKSNPVFDRILTNNTFCAGGQAKGPCHGDSGSGLYHVVERVWYLRGVVSTSLGNSFVCYTDEYAVYVDITPYCEWIHQYISVFGDVH